MLQNKKLIQFLLLECVVRLNCNLLTKVALLLATVHTTLHGPAMWLYLIELMSAPASTSSLPTDR